VGQSEEIRLLSLPPAELRVLLALRHMVDRWGEVNVTMDELKVLTGYGRTTLSKAVAGLSEAGFIDTVRTKRNLGKLSKNRYYLTPCSPEQTWEVKSASEVVLPCSTERTSTASEVVTSSNSNVISNTKVKNTSYSLVATGHGGVFKEVSLVNKWDDDDDIGGFGLLDGEVPASRKVRPVSKRDPKTRHQRPQEDWTAADVASEFSWRVYDKVRGIPGMVNTNKLRLALSQNRVRFGSTATIEMELMDKFFGDARNLDTIKRTPQFTHAIFLRFITANISGVVTELGMDEPEVDNYERPEYIYASDGKKFDNSMPGRKAMERYEEKIGGQ
jgi:DNA-binding MarR family transcriptional regulator